MSRRCVQEWKRSQGGELHEEVLEALEEEAAFVVTQLEAYGEELRQ